MTWVKDGAKCICIQTMVRATGPAPTIGETYTIREPHIDPWGHLCIGLVEMVDKKANFIPGRIGPYWLATWFRPLVSLRGDVRAIKSMLRALPAETRLDRLLEALDE